MNRLLALAFAATLMSVVLDARDMKGDLVLAGNQQLIVDNEALHVQGKVILRGSASLVLRNNSSLITVQVYHEQFLISLHDQASLIVENSTLGASFDITEVQLFGNSRLVARKARIDHMIVLRDGASLDVSDSTILGLGIDPLSYKFASGWGCASAILRNASVHEVALGLNGTGRAAFVGLKPGVATSFAVGGKRLGAGDLPYEATFQECAISNITFSVGERAQAVFDDCRLQRVMVFDSASVWIEDTAVCELGFQLERVDVSFGGLKAGYHDEWVLQASRGRIPCSIAIKNSTIDAGWHLRLRGGRYTISDSVIVRLRDEFDDEHAVYHLVRCCIDEWMPWWDHGTIILEDCILGRIQTPDGATPSLQGSFRVLDPEVSEVNGPWRNNSTITRSFPVWVSSPDGAPVANVEVRLLDLNGRVVHSVRTDARGRADPGVRVVFTEANYRQEWTVLVPSTGESQRIGIGSSTPIVFPAGPATWPDPPCVPHMSGPDNPQISPGVPASVEGPREGGCVCGVQPLHSWDETLLLARSASSVGHADLDIDALYADDNGAYLYVRMDLVGAEPDCSDTRYRYEVYLADPTWGYTRFKVVAGRGALEKMHGTVVVGEAVRIRCSITTVIEVEIPLDQLPPFSRLTITGQTCLLADEGPTRVFDRLEARYIPK